MELSPAEGGPVRRRLRKTEEQQLELQSGMTIALEPKLIFPGKGVVGIENSHVVTKDGLEQLGRFPEDVFVV